MAIQGYDRWTYSQATLVQWYLYSETPTANAKLPESKIIDQGGKDIVHEVKKKK
jgi:hypothetical protein